MTGLRSTSYQSRWHTLQPQRKFSLWLAMMILAFVLPPAAGQGIELLDHCRIELLAIAHIPLALVSMDMIPFDFVGRGVITIIFSISREPQILLAGISVGPYWIGITVRAWSRRMTRSGVALDGAVRDVVAGDEPTVSAVN